VLADLDLLSKLREKCQKDRYKQNPVCQVVNTLPDVPLDELGDLIGNVLGGVLGRAFGTSLRSGQPTSTASTRALYGGTS
jgi:hypothetical protein